MSLSGHVVSWIARSINCGLVTWDFRHDCRKHIQLANPDSMYRHCAGVDYFKVETEQLLQLSHLLLLIALKMYSIEIVGTISFSSITSTFKA